MRARFLAAPRRRSAGLSRNRRRRPHRGTGGAVDRNQLLARRMAAIGDLFAGDFHLTVFLTLFTIIKLTEITNWRP